MIVITTPTGQIGSQVLASLLGGGEKVRVIDLIAASGVAYRALVNLSFMDNTARQAPINIDGPMLITCAGV